MKSSHGRKEFNNKKLPYISEEYWARIEGLCVIIDVFASATEVLSAEKYPTFVYCLPVLRQIKNHLNDDFLKFQ